MGVCILSNLVDSRLAARFEFAEFQQWGIGVQEAAVFPKTDPYRAATHNKGVLNGIDPNTDCDGNNWRAVEAGAHAYCARSGKYHSPSRIGGTRELTWLEGLKSPWRLESWVA